MSLDTEKLSRISLEPRQLNQYDLAEVMGCQKPLAPQLASYEARVLLRRLQGYPDLEGEVFLRSPEYRKAREQADREEMVMPYSL